MPIRRTDKKPSVSSVESVYEFSEDDMNIEFIDYRLPRYRFRGSRACIALSALREEKRAVRPAGARRAEQLEETQVAPAAAAWSQRCCTQLIPSPHTQSHRFLSVLLKNFDTH